MSMSLPEDARHRLSQWCAAQVTGAERRRRQVGYTVHGDVVTVAERRAPRYPELGTSWTTRPLLRVRLRGPGAGRGGAPPPGGGGRGGGAPRRPRGGGGGA